MKYIISNPLAIHEIGKRTNQEDSQFPTGTELNDKSRVFILCDGMGGHEFGEVASSTVCETIGTYFKENSVNGQLTIGQFEQALDSAYDALDLKDDPLTEKKMGTTMTFLCFHSAGITAAHIGDSRIYQIRPGESKPVFKTYDHSLVNDLIRIGEMTEEEARTSKNKNVITRAMQPNQERRSKADIKLLTDIRPDDWFYMCSDGMLEQMDDSEIISILTDDSKSDEEKRQTLIDLTADNKDNHTAYLIHILDVSDEPEQPISDKKEDVPVVTIINESDDIQTTSDEIQISSANYSRTLLRQKFPKARFAIVIAALAILISIIYWIASKDNSKDNESAHNNTEQIRKPQRSSNQSHRNSPEKPSEVEQQSSVNEEAGMQELPEENPQPSLGAEYFNELPASPQNNLFN